MIGVTVSSGNVVLVAAVFIACAVEMVEALTIVFAVGHTRGWRSALAGVSGCTRVVAGRWWGHSARRSCTFRSMRCVSSSVAVLLVFGLQWLRKAILRSSGLLGKAR